VRIALCDDEQKELSYLQALIKEYDSSIDVSLFLSAEQLLDNLSRQSCDLIFLDIEMAGLNGFDAAKELTNRQNAPLIVFVTNSGAYTYRGYEVAFRYLPKPVSYAVLAEVLSDAMSIIAPQKFMITADGCSYVISINDIRYVEVFSHTLVVHTKMRDFACRMKLSEIEEALPENAFAKPHNSYLVNLAQVHMVGEKELSLIGNVKIPLSRRRKQEFEQALFRFVRRQR
jgi:DNA-binding LytR/AlgR family response regulator